MARLNGGLYSKLKGKLAGTVFQQYEGMNVVKEYQPTVKNPSTSKQVENRAKFKAASQLVAVFADIFMISIAKISSYQRNLRGSLVRVLTRTFQWNESTDAAEIAENAVASAVNGLTFNPPIPAPVLSGTTIGQATISATEGDTVKYKIVAYDRDGLTLGTAERTFEATSTPETIQAPLTATTPFGYTIAAVATRLATDEGNASYGNLVNCDMLNVFYGVSAGDILASHIAYGTLSQA